MTEASLHVKLSSPHQPQFTNEFVQFMATVTPPGDYDYNYNFGNGHTYTVTDGVSGTIFSYPGVHNVSVAVSKNYGITSLRHPVVVYDRPLLFRSGMSSYMSTEGPVKGRIGFLAGQSLSLSWDLYDHRGKYFKGTYQII